MTFASMTYSYYGSRSDHMDVLNRYREYKVFWDRHRIPGQHYNEVLWEDPWWKTHNANTRRRPRRLPPLSKSPQKKEKSKEKRQATFIADKKEDEKEVQKQTSDESEIIKSPSSAHTAAEEEQNKVVNVPTDKDVVTTKAVARPSSVPSHTSSKSSIKEDDSKSLSRKSSSSSISSKSSESTNS